MGCGNSSPAESGIDKNVSTKPAAQEELSDRTPDVKLTPRHEPASRESSNPSAKNEIDPPYNGIDTHSTKPNTSNSKLMLEDNNRSCDDPKSDEVDKEADTEKTLCGLPVKEETDMNDNDNVNNGNEDSNRQSTSETEVQQNDTQQQVENTNPTPIAESDAVIHDSAATKAASTSGNDRGSESADEQKRLTEVQNVFDAAVRCSCLLTSAGSVMERAHKDVCCLQLQRSLPHTLSVFSLMQRLPHLQELDLSANQIGPQPFRALMFAMAYNQTISSLNVANNHTDTDCAESVGIMLQKNSTLISLNIGGNYLGKDYLSRCVGPALAKNITLRHLNCEAVGSVDFSVLMEGARSSSKLVSLNLSHNTISKTAPLVEHLMVWLQKPDCQLSKIEMKNCGLKDNDLLQLATVLKTNSSIKTVYLSSNQVPSSRDFVELLSTCLGCSSLTSLAMDNMKVTQVSDTTSGEKLASPSSVTDLNLSGCQLSDDMISAILARLPDKGLAMLENLNLSNNPDLCVDVLKQMLPFNREPDGQYKLEKLSYGQNRADDLPDMLIDMNVSNLVYLNLRRAKMTPTSVSKLGKLTHRGLETIVLDNIKISNTTCLKDLLGGKSCGLVALSLADCSLIDDDVAQVADALRDGLQLSMLKLSSNRIGDKGIRLIVDALLTESTHPVKLIDLSSNRMGSKGADALSELITSSSHKSQIHSLNISRNNIEGHGLQQLVAATGSGKLNNLIANNQDAHYDEEDMDAIYAKLAESLGLSMREEGSCTVPDVQVSFTLKLNGLGGFAGDLGRMLDSIAVVTDYRSQLWPHLNMASVLQVGASLKGQDDSVCMFTKEEWDNIIGAKKGAPRWLQLEDHRERALYLSHLPAAITANKMEGLLEMEADCNVDEVVLLKDQLTQKNNGLAWILLSDVASVKRAVDFFNSGEAKVFGQTFLLSRLDLAVDDEENEGHAAARAEMNLRAADRAKDEAAHRQLLRQNYTESQARHAYRLANPAYADGRIW